MEIDVNDYLKAITDQRNQLMDQCAQLQAYIAKLERERAKPVEPDADGAAEF